MTPVIRKERIWPTIIVGILTVYVAFGLIAARVASHDPNFAIEPDYYQKAVKWDSTLALSRRSAALRWHLIPTLGPVSKEKKTPLTFEVRDSAGAFVTKAHISVEARQVAHAEEVAEAKFDERSDGEYAATLPLSRPGLWEFRVFATRGPDQFATTLRMDASTTADAQVVAQRPGDPPPTRVEAGTRRDNEQSNVRR